MCTDLITLESFADSVGKLVSALSNRDKPSDEQQMWTDLITLELFVYSVGKPSYSQTDFCVLFVSL